MRAPLAGVTVLINGTVTASSTTVAAVGANALVFATAAPDHATTVTSCYLARSDAALAVSRLVADAHDEHLSQHLVAATEHHATLAGACLLEHAGALRELLTARTQHLVAVDVDLAALEQVARAWAAD